MMHARAHAYVVTSKAVKGNNTMIADMSLTAEMMLTSTASEAQLANSAASAFQGLQLWSPTCVTP